jgi:hypothetical protein
MQTKSYISGVIFAIWNPRLTDATETPSSLQIYLKNISDYPRRILKYFMGLLMEEQLKINLSVAQSENAIDHCLIFDLVRQTFEMFYFFDENILYIFHLLIY